MKCCRCVSLTFQSCWSGLEAVGTGAAGALLRPLPPLQASPGLRRSTDAATSQLQLLKSAISDGDARGRPLWLPTASSALCL